MVAWGRVFRSGTLANLTDDDHGSLRALSIAFICDLRTERERHSYPSRWLPHGNTEIWSHRYDHSAADLVQVLAGPDPDCKAGHELILELYRGLPYDQAEGYRELLTRIAAGQLPVLFHCTAGKDRTGVLGGILLDLLGVDRSLIIEDYAMSDDHYDALYQMFLRDRRMHDFAEINPERFAPLLRADPEYLTTSFATIAARHGSTAAYVTEVLGLDDVAIGRIRDNLLVAPGAGLGNSQAAVDE